MPFFSTGLDRLETVLGRRLSGCILLGLVVVAYTVSYWQHPLLPQSDPSVVREGWWTWHDQFAYWQSAAELARGSLTAEHYHYPLGYPLLGAAALRLMPVHPFFPANLLLVLAAGFAWWLLLRRGGLSRVQTLVVVGLFCWTHGSLLALTLVIPWNTIATQATLLTGMVVMLTLRDGRRVLWLSGLAAITYLFRPGDAVCFAPMLVWSVLSLPGWRERMVRGLTGIGVISAAVVLVGLLNLSVFERWSSPYERLSWDAVGFVSYPVSWMWFWLMVDGEPFFGETGTALIFRYPWMLLLPAGLVWFVRKGGGAAVAVLATVMMSWGFYTSYNDFVPSAIFRFSLIHYISWSFPLLFGLTVTAVVRGWRERATRVGLGVSVGLAVLATGLHLEERELPAEVAMGSVEQLPVERPLWVKFPGDSLEQAGALQLDGRRLQESLDYHIPYVPADLRILLGRRTPGTRLAAPAEAGITAVPVVGHYVWAWEWTPARWWPPRQ